MRYQPLRVLGVVLSLGVIASAAGAQPAPSPSVEPAQPAPSAPIDPASPDAPAPSEPRANPPAGSCSAAPPSSIPAARPCKPRRPPQVDNVPDVASLKTPESPAFMALGIAPSDIQRPGTPTALKASLVNGFAAGGPLPVLQNFALEFAPYWLFPHRRLSYQQVVAQPAAALYRNLALSFATSPLEVEQTTEGGVQKTTYGRFASGLRMTLWPGTPTRTARQCEAYLMHALQSSAAERNQAEAEFAEAWRADHPPPVLVEPEKPDPARFAEDPEALFAAMARYTAALTNLRANSPDYLAWEQDKEAAENEFQRRYVSSHVFDDPRFQRCLSDLHAREGFMAEAAGAYTFMVPRGDIEQFKQNALQTGTAWLTLGWVFEDLFRREMEGSVLAVFRGQRGWGSPRDVDEDTITLDAGARLALAYSRFGIAIEGTYRRRRYDPSTEPVQHANLYRAALSLDCHLSGGVWLSGTFGKDFGTEQTTPILALANLQWNFSLDRGVKPDATVTQ